MAISASRDALQLTGNLAFGAGGVDVKHLIGSFIKTVHFTRDNDYIVIFQNSSGVEDNIILPPGWLIAAIEPTNPSPYKGMGWYDTTSNSLKIHDGSSFVLLTGGTLLANGSVTTVKIKDDAVTPAKLDADNATKQDAFLTRLNALRRDLNNIATLTIAEQRTLLLSLGTLIDGPRPLPSAAYSGRTWIDDHNDRSYICRNRQEVSAVLGGGFADADTTRVGIEIAENLGDLDDPANPVATDYAYTYEDNKWWQGAVRNSQNVWQETQPTTALLARLTLKQGWTAVWLGKHRWDYNAREQLPQSALPADTDYYFYNSRTVTIRKFNRASYVATGQVSDHWQWESLVATAAEIDIIEARDGNLPALSYDGTDDRQIAIANDGIHFVQLIPEAASAATAGSWAAYVYSNTNPYRRYIGVIAEDPASSTIGDFYYSTTRRRWRIYRAAGAWAWFNNHWEDLSDEDIAWPVRFIGNHGSRAEAVAYAASSGITTGQTFVAFTGSQMETGSQFFQGTSARFSRHWRFIPLNPPMHTAQLFLDDVFSMPGGPSEAVEIEDGNTGRNWKSVYRLDHGVRISKVKIAVEAVHAQGREDFRLSLLKGFVPDGSDENTVHVSDVLWPVNIEQRKHDQFTAPVLVTTPHTFDIPEVVVNRGEYLVVQLARVSTLSSRSRSRIVRDLTEQHTFEAFRFVGSGTDDRDSGVAANYGVDNVEWTDAGLWIEIEYAIEYDVDAAVAAHGNDDFTQFGAFTLDEKNLSLRLTRELGGHVDVPVIDLAPIAVPDNDSITEAKLATDVKAKLQTDADVTTIANARALARYTVAEKTKLSGAAPLANPTFTGQPKAPTPVSAGDDTQIATKKYVDDNASGLADDSVTPAKLDAGDNTKKQQLRARIAAAAKNSPVLTGTPTAPTPVSASGDTQIATKKYVDNAAVGGNAGLVRGPLLAQVTLPTTSRAVGQAVFTGSELAWSIPAGVTGVTASTVDILNLNAIPDNVGDAAIGIFVCVTVGTDEILCELFPWLHSISSISWWTKSNLFIVVELGKDTIVGTIHWYMQLQSFVGGTAVLSYDADTKVNVYLARAAGPVGPVGPEGSVSAAELAAEVVERKKIDTAEAIARDLEDTALGTRIDNEAIAREEDDNNEITLRTDADSALGTKIRANRIVADAALVAATAAASGIVPYSPGLSPNTFIGANRAAAIKALDDYLDGVTTTTQASVRIYADANNYITVSIKASTTVGPKSNKWKMKWGGDDVLQVETADSIFQAIVKWDVGVTTLNALHELFHGDSKFESEVTGDDALIASVIETFGADMVGNTIFFSGGTRVHTDVPNAWFTYYTGNLAATITLEYGSRQELQVWDTALIDFRTVLTLIDSPMKGVEVVYHTTQVSYDAASATDGKLHIITV